jgi:hypothetical protein
MLLDVLPGITVLVPSYNAKSVIEYGLEPISGKRREAENDLVRLIASRYR